MNKKKYDDGGVPQRRRLYVFWRRLGASRSKCVIHCISFIEKIRHSEESCTLLSSRRIRTFHVCRPSSIDYLCKIRQGDGHFHSSATHHVCDRSRTSLSHFLLVPALRAGRTFCCNFLIPAQTCAPVERAQGE